MLSPLLQLDREFDFLVPENTEVRFGQRVSFLFGRSKKPLSGFIVEVLANSEFARTELLSVETHPVLTPELLAFARLVADRQCVALGEILALAIPDSMPRVEVPHLDPVPKRAPTAPTKEVILGSGRQVPTEHGIYPDWALEFVDAAKRSIKSGHSVILLAPEKSDAQMLSQLASALNLDHKLLLPGAKKSERYVQFFELIDQTALVIGTRSAIYAPVANLGLIALCDDLDESYRDQGSPHTHARELALMRASDSVSLLFAAPYRSVELQRLVEIGYLKERELSNPMQRVSFTEPGLRIDDAAFQLVRQSLDSGPILVLLPRKGMAASAWCNGCGERQRCDCGGFIWEPEQGQFDCRICGKPHIKCQACESRELRPGRKASGRTLAEIGRAFPKAQVLEAAGNKKPSGLGKPNQILIATPGSAPRLANGYSALLILDPDVWLSAQSLHAELHAIRDWTEAMELTNPSGRVVIAGLGQQLGKPISLWQHRELAKSSYRELKQLGLPPATRVVSLEAESQVLAQATSALEELGARRLRKGANSASFAFAYQAGTSVSKALRAVALTAASREVTGQKRRGLKIVMDDAGMI